MVTDDLWFVICIARMWQGAGAEGRGRRRRRRGRRQRWSHIRVKEEVGRSNATAPEVPCAAHFPGFMACGRAADPKMMTTWDSLTLLHEEPDAIACHGGLTAAARRGEDLDQGQDDCHFARTSKRTAYGMTHFTTQPIGPIPSSTFGRTNARYFFHVPQMNM
jgi:hypothetical protein